MVLGAIIWTIVSNIGWRISRPAFGALAGMIVGPITEIILWDTICWQYIAQNIGYDAAGLLGGIGLIGAFFVGPIIGVVVGVSGVFPKRPANQNSASKAS